MPDGVNPVVDTNLGPPAAAAANPLGTAGGAVGLMNELAEMRNRQNQNLLFQQQMTARHQLGQDLTVWASQGLSPEQQIERASHQPYAPFVTPELGNFRASNLAGVQVQETEAKIGQLRQQVANTGLEKLTQVLAATGGDPAKFDAAFKVATAGQPPQVVSALSRAYPAIKTSLTANLPNDPEAAKAEVAARTRNLGVTLGLPLDKAYAMTGGVAPGVQEIPGAEGQTTKAIVSGGGASPTSATILGTSPTKAGATAMEIQGRQQAGLPPTFETITGPAGQPLPAVVSGGGGGAPAIASPLLSPGTTTPLAGPTQTQSKYADARGSAMASYQENLDDRVKSGAQIMQTLAPAWEAFKDLQAHGQSTGGLATAKTAIASFLQGIGAKQETYDKIMKLDSAQEISKLMVSTTMLQIQQQLPATSKLAVGEFNAFMKNNPNLDTDPRAMEKIFNFWTKIHSINRVEQTELNKYLAQGGNISEWPEKWQSIAEQQGFVSKNPTGTASGAKARPPIESFFK